MVKQKEDSVLKNKKVVFGFAVFAAISGLYFLNKNLTGNVVSGQGYTLNIVSMIGVLLLFCSGILIFYTLKKA